MIVPLCLIPNSIPTAIPLRNFVISEFVSMYDTWQKVVVSIDFLTMTLRQRGQRSTRYLGVGGAGKFLDLDIIVADLLDIIRAGVAAFFVRDDDDLSEKIVSCSLCGFICRVFVATPFNQLLEGILLHHVPSIVVRHLPQ